MRPVALLVFSCFTVVSYAATTNPVPSKPRLQQRASTSVPAPPVDLSYGIFQGYSNSTSQLDIYKGYCGSSRLLSVQHMGLSLMVSRIRYAAPPIGSLRWQKPQRPAVNRSQSTAATAYPSRCPQGNDAPLYVNPYLKAKNQLV
jgi:hypothetical protein